MGTMEPRWLDYFRPCFYCHVHDECVSGVSPGGYSVAKLIGMCRSENWNGTRFYQQFSSKLPVFTGILSIFQPKTRFYRRFSKDQTRF